MDGLLASPCQPSGAWVDGDSRTRCADYVLKMQRRLDKAVSDNDQDRIRHITYLLLPIVKDIGGGFVMDDHLMELEL